MATPTCALKIVAAAEQTALKVEGDFIVKASENEKIISQFVGIIKWYDQSGDRVLKNDKRFHF